MSVFGLFRKRSSTPAEEPPDPRLTPGSLERWRAMSPRERRRIHNEAHEKATEQVTVYGRPYQENYDGYLELKLGGHFKRMADAIAEELRKPSAGYVSPAAADAFMFGQTGDAAFLPAGWRGPKDERDVSLAATDEEYWAAMYPTGLLDREIAQAYMLGVASRKEAPAK